MRTERESEEPWVRIASSVPLAKSFLKENGLFAESTLEAMRSQGRAYCQTVKIYATY